MKTSAVYYPEVPAKIIVKRFKLKTKLMRWDLINLVNSIGHEILIGKQRKKKKKKKKTRLKSLFVKACFQVVMEQANHALVREFLCHRF